MMNIPPGEADRLDLRTYEGLLFHWNEAHATDSDAAPDYVDLERAEHTAKLIDIARADPRLLH